MRRGFSMLEMVVVIAIIAVLAAVLFPVFGQALHKAHETGCVSNLHQVDLAAELYRQDQGEYPVEMPDGPAFRPYFSGKPPVCPAAKNPSLSYVVIGFNARDASDAARPKKQAYNRAFDECRDKRGPDIPVVMDDNHIGKVEGYRSGEPFFLFARASGALVRVPVARWTSMAQGQTPTPCDRRLWYFNL